MQLRDYQTEAITALQNALAEGVARPLIEAPTGAGKSVILAHAIAEWAEHTDRRFLVLTHTKELVQQDHDAIARVMGAERVGIYSAGLSRRDTAHRVVVGGIQSVARHAGRLGRRDVVIIDEAHRLPRSGWGQYRSVLQSTEYPLGVEYLIGLTATPYRLDGGSLTEGDDAPFDRVIFSIPVKRLIAAGHLAPLRPIAVEDSFETTGLRVERGEFVADEKFAAAMSDFEILERIVDGWTRRAKRPDGSLRTTLVFCASLPQMTIVEGMIAERGISVASISGETPDSTNDNGLWDEEDAGRTATIRRFKSGGITALLNCNVLTTGFDAPNVECILSLRPTASPGLHVQMLGRGTRCAPGKTDCLVLDHAGNVERHGPIDTVTPPRRGSGAAPAQTVKAIKCPECETLYAVGEPACPFCGAVREKAPRALAGGLDLEPSTADLIASGANELHIAKTTFICHTARSGKDCVRISHQVARSKRRVDEFFAFDSDSDYARAQAAKTWMRRFPGSPAVPTSTAEAIAMLAEAPDHVWPAKIITHKDGPEKQYDRVVAWIMGPRADEPEPEPEVTKFDSAFWIPSDTHVSQLGLTDRGPKGPDQSWMKDPDYFDKLEVPF